MIELQITHLTKVFSTPSNRLMQFIPFLNKTMDKYDINSVFREAAFLGQVAVESEDFTHVEENLNYSADALLTTWPSHFNDDNVDAYARQPQKIANRAYANRMGNGDEASGDGWAYRGRGLIQITGKNNYKSIARDFGMTLEAMIQYLETLEGATVSAGWFWDIEDCNPFADAQNLRAVTKCINGGYEDLVQRTEYYQKLKAVLSQTV